MTLRLYIISWSFFWWEVLLMWLVSRCYLCHTWIQLMFMAPRIISFVVSRADDSNRRDIESFLPLLFPQTYISTKQIFCFGKWHVLIVHDTWHGESIHNLNGDDAPYENKRRHYFLPHCEVIVHLNGDINLKNAWDADGVDKMKRGGLSPCLHKGLISVTHHSGYSSSVNKWSSSGMYISNV